MISCSWFERDITNTVFLAYTLKKYIILLRKGNIGNQLFQYYAVKQLFPHLPVILVGYDQLESAFEGIVSLRSFDSLIRFISQLGIARLERILHSTLIFNSLRELHSENISLNYSFKRGLFSFISVISDSYFQSEAAVSPPISSPLSIKAEFVSAALVAISPLLEGGNLYFVCIRRGDYVSWPSRLHPAVLPLSYYLRYINEIRGSDPDARFLILSDDPAYVKDFFEESYFHFFSGDFAHTLAAMSICSSGGILSASSFCWWGAYFCLLRNPGARFIAPRFWIRHSERIWEPLGIHTSWIDYVDVEYPDYKNTISILP
jgi:hypothetical protein